MINEPVDWEQSQSNLVTQPYKQPLYQDGTIEDNFGVRYHFNQIIIVHIVNYDTSGDEKKMYVPTDIIGAFRYVLNKERNISSTRAVKIQAGLTIQIEKHSKTPMKNYVANYSVPGDYVTYEIRHYYQDQSKMLQYLYVFPTKEEETQKYIDYLTGYVSQILEHIYGGSSAKFICICGVSFYIYRLSKTGTRMVGMEKYTKNQNIYSCLSGEHMCVLECFSAKFICICRISLYI
jgi:hypothetical protein